MPPLEGMIGEEIPLDQLIGPEEEEGDDIPLDQLVGTGEVGFLVLNGGMQLPPNPNEEELMGLADDLYDEHMQDQHIEEHELGENAAVDNKLTVPEDVLPDNLEVNDQEVPAHQLQVGFALVQMDRDPALLDWEKSKRWSHYFCKNSPSNLSVHIPESRSIFFTVMLLSPVNFSWAKDFVASNAFQLFQDSNASINFNIPVKCPAHEQSLCLTEAVEGHDLTGKGKNKVGEMVLTDVNATKCTSKKRGSQRGPPLSKNEVTRSERFKQKTMGLNLPYAPIEGAFLALHAPQILSTKLIQNLCSQFCKMDHEELSEEALTRKKRKATVNGKKMPIQGQSGTPANGEGSSTAADDAEDSPDTRIEEALDDEENLED